MNETDGWISFESFTYRGVDPADAQRRADQFLNPILAGFYPDPSVCRVGDDFYLVNSSFAYFPGVPIFRSRDLVNWTQLGHVLDRESQLGTLQDVAVSGGIYAPTIRFHNGRFYMITTLIGGPGVGGGGNFFVWSQNPQGPWSDPIDLKQVNGIDPSLFFDDDGHVYVVNNGESPDNKPLYNGHRALWLQEIDLNSGQVIGPQKIIVNGGTDLAQKPVWIEGPHLFKKDGFYYLIAAEGGTGERHSEVVFRSQQIWGPYEPWKGNPILTQRDLPADRPNPITCTGHADFVELADGQWWAVFLGCRPYEGDWYNTGRETFLLPVQWKDGWPIILEHGQPIPRALARPNLPIAPIAHPSSRPASTLTGSFDSQDDFTDPTLSPQWMFLRTPTQHWFEISDQSLRLEPRPVSLTRRDNPSFIGRRQQHAAFSVEVTIRIELRNQDADAGLVAFQNETHHLFAGVRISGGSAAAIFLETINEPETQWKTAEPQVIAELLLNTAAQNVRMRISATGRSHEVHYRLDNGGDWLPLKTDLDGSFLSTSVAEGFQGVMLGMFARSVQ